MTLRQAVLDAVSEAQGIKATELVVKVAHAFFGGKGPVTLENKPENVTDTIEALIQEGLLVEVEYTLPCGEGEVPRVKSFLLPKGTRVRNGLRWGLSFEMTQPPYKGTKVPQSHVDCGDPECVLGPHK
jgi:hypothetical protein